MSDLTSPVSSDLLSDIKPFHLDCTECHHLNKTTTYEDPRKDWSEEPPLPREVTLTRHPELGFGFVAGSEKPVIVRFVTEGGPSVDLLQPGDQILSVNGENVKKAPRDHVIKLVRACKEVVRLTVCQPPLDNSNRKSALLSAAKKAKLRSHPSRVRFAEGVVVNGSPLFPPSMFSNGESSIPVLPNVLKVYLENGQTKSFKYDSSTTVQDVVTSLLQKLCIWSSEHFSLVVEHFKSLRRNKLTLLDPRESVARVAARPGSHNLRCLFRVTFMPKDAAELAQKDLVAFEYLYMQCCNDVVQERYAPELKYDLALRLAALHIHQHALAHNLAGKLTIKSVEREFGLERFVPVSLMATMKRKELRKLLAHFLKLNQNILTGQKSLTSFQAKLHYLNIVGELPSYGAKCFSTNIRDANMETVLLVSPKFGISQILGIRNSVPVGLADLEDMRALVVRREDELSRIVRIFLTNRELTFSLEDRDAEELVLVLRGYYHLFTGDDLEVDEERDPWPEDCAPLYMSPHEVRPAPWSYATANESRSRIINFSVTPSYQSSPSSVRAKLNGHVGGKPSLLPGEPKCGVDSNMNIKSNSTGDHRNYFHQNGDVQDGDTHPIIPKINNTKNDEVLKRVAEMQALVMTSEQYLTEQREGAQHPPNKLTKLQEEEDSEGSHVSSGESEIPAPGELKHSDSLLLLTQVPNSTDDLEDVVRRLEIDDPEPSESDTDSASTPAGSPSQKARATDKNRQSTQSFGLHSPDALGTTSCAFQNYIQRLKEGTDLPFELVDGAFYFDPDIIDLTNIPPPATPDDGVNPLPVQPSLPPTPFADTAENKVEPSIYWGEEEQESMTTTGEPDELEAFLATVAVAPPDRAHKITSEEIMSYIIPPPPKTSSSFGTNTGENNKKGDNCREPLRPFFRRNSFEAEPIVRQNGHVTYSPKLSWKESPMSCGRTGQFTPGWDGRLSRRGGPEISLRVQKLVKVSEWPQKNGPLKLSLVGVGDGGDRCPCGLSKAPSSYDSLPRSLMRGSSNSPEIKCYRTISKDCCNQVDKEISQFGTLTKPVSGRNLSAEIPGRDVSAVTNQQPMNNYPVHTYRNGLVMYRMEGQPSPEHRGQQKCNPEFRDKICKGGVWSGPMMKREDLLTRCDDTLGILLVRLDQLAAECDKAQYQGGGHNMNEEKFQVAKDAVTEEACELVAVSRNLVKQLTSTSTDAELAESCSGCLDRLKKLCERCAEMSAHTGAPVHTRNIILRVHDVASACRKVLRRPTTQQSEHLAEMLTSLLRSLRVFE
ncbi:hypothetical protein RUM43_011104 [Polyplax serrata]|uniref:FERM and PDZ domain-containing protein 4 n=1 Tax=Polyplax serrata TaxID=468196 RepID=A0AAN8RTD1_POLSC